MRFEKGRKFSAPFFLFRMTIQVQYDMKTYRTLKKTKKKVTTNLCSCCGQKPKKTLVTYTCWITEVDSFIYQCPNKKCKWHLAPFIWDQDEYDKWQKEHKVQDEYYISVLDRIQDFGNDNSVRETYWNKYHKGRSNIEKPKTEKVKEVVPEKFIAIDSLEL